MTNSELCIARADIQKESTSVPIQNAVGYNTLGWPSRSDAAIGRIWDEFDSVDMLNGG